MIQSLHIDGVEYKIGEPIECDDCDNGLVTVIWSKKGGYKAKCFCGAEQWLVRTEERTQEPA